MSDTVHTFIDLFGAPGGMSLGFKLAGMRPAGALDSFKAGIETYRENFPEVPEKHVVCADAARSDIVERFQRQTSLKPGDVDVIIGGPPCQGFSTVGRVRIASLVRNGKRSGRSGNARFIDDKRNNLYKRFVKFVEYYKPKAIVMENVVGMASYKNGSVVDQIKEDFGPAYKNIDCRILNAADYGVPQLRRRLFFVATRRNSSITWPEKTHAPEDVIVGDSMSGLEQYVTVENAIGDLPRLPIPAKNVKKTDSVRKYRCKPSLGFQEWARGSRQTVGNNITRWHRRKDIEVFANMSQGCRWSNLSDADRKKIGYSDDSFNDKWKRLTMGSPSWTVTSHLSRDGYMYIHPTQNRTISVREAARLQSFPDWFVFRGSRSAQFRQIGNAVPPLLAEQVALHLKRILSD